jgi:hypothetical protein
MMDEAWDFDAWLVRVQGALDQGWFQGPRPQDLVPLAALDPQTLAVGGAIGLIRPDLIREDEPALGPAMHPGSSAEGGVIDLDWAHRAGWYSRFWRDMAVSAPIPHWSTEYDRWQEFSQFPSEWGDTSGPLGELRTPGLIARLKVGRAKQAEQFTSLVMSALKQDLEDLIRHREGSTT